MDDDGYLTMDALTGLTLTVLALVVVLSAYASALSMGRRALAERQAMVLGLWVLETQWPALNGEGLRQGGGAPGWTWRLDATVTQRGDRANLCHLQVTVRRPGTISRSIQTDRICAT